MTPEMEILDAEIEGGILAGSGLTQEKENGYLDNNNLARQDVFDDYDDYDEEEF